MPRNQNILANLSDLDQFKQRLGTTLIPRLVDRDTAFDSAINLLAMEQELRNDAVSVGRIPTMNGYAANLVSWRESLEKPAMPGRFRKNSNSDNRILRGQRVSPELTQEALRMVSDKGFCITRMNQIYDIYDRLRGVIRE